MDLVVRDVLLIDLYFDADFVFWTVIRVEGSELRREKRRE